MNFSKKYYKLGLHDSEMRVLFIRFENHQDVVKSS